MLLLALLPLIALLLYLDGQRYDPQLLELKPTTGGAATALFPERLAGLERVGQLRIFDRETLYEYINGHAEYYLGAGFEGLTVGEYGMGVDGQPQVVINLYHMGNALNAFGALAEEAGEQEPVQIGALGFGSGQGVNFIHGPYYVQLTLFSEGADPLEAAVAMAGHLQERVQGA